MPYRKLLCRSINVFSGSCLFCSGRQDVRFYVVATMVGSRFTLSHILVWFVCVKVCVNRWRRLVCSFADMLFISKLFWVVYCIWILLFCFINWSITHFNNFNANYLFFLHHVFLLDNKDKTTQVTRCINTVLKGFTPTHIHLLTALHVVWF